MESIESPFQFERHSNHGVVTLNPMINEGQWGTVSEVGNEILVHLETLPGQSLVVDLSRLHYIGSTQVALLVRMWKSLKKMQGQMSIECPSVTVREILATAGLRALWQIVDTRKAALAAMGIAQVSPNRFAPWTWFRFGAHWRQPSKWLRAG